MNAVSLQIPMETNGADPISVPRKRKIETGPDELSADEGLAKKATTTGYDAECERVEAAFDEIERIDDQAVTGCNQVEMESGLDVDASKDNVTPEKGDAAGQEDDSVDREDASADPDGVLDGDVAGRDLGPGGAADRGEDFDTHYIEVSPRNTNGNSPAVRVPYRCHLCTHGRVPHTEVSFDVLRENFINSVRAHGDADCEWVNDIVQAIYTFIDDSF